MTRCGRPVGRAEGLADSWGLLSYIICIMRSVHQWLRAVATPAANGLRRTSSTAGSGDITGCSADTLRTSADPPGVLSHWQNGGFQGWIVDRWLRRPRWARTGQCGAGIPIKGVAVGALPLHPLHYLHCWYT